MRVGRKFRQIGRLNALLVSRTKEQGIHADGGGLYLHVSESGSKSWIFRYRMDGRRTPRDMGLGSLHTLTLAEARVKATDARKLILDGRDPIEVKRAARAARIAEAAKSMTFDACSRSYVESHKAGWRNEKHAEQWKATLDKYAHPVIGRLPVAAVETAHVMRILEPIWNDKPETASRLRGRIELVLGWATARGYRIGDNPARWRDLLENLLPSPNAVKKVQHHAALPYADMGAFMAALREQDGVAARALEFTILTAARTSEVTGAAWNEIDTIAGTWTVPAERIKMKKEHRVPLSEPALAVLRGMARVRTGNLVFPGGKAGKPLSSNAMLAVLERMGRTEITVHGFRSTFRDWAAERTNYPREVCEMALAHAIGDKVEAAYRRGDLFDKRRRLMGEWAKFCGTVSKTGDVISLQRA